MEKAEMKICGYSSVLITLFVNSGKLLALRENGILARYWHFNIGELGVQAVYTLVYCLIFFYLNLGDKSPFQRIRHQKGQFAFYLINLCLVLVALVVGGMIQLSVFGASRPVAIYWTGYLMRIGLCTVFTGIMIKIMHLMRDSRKIEVEHEKLKNAYFAAELELLTEQINPHFLFNAFSILTGIIRENPGLAQRYVRALSDVFRYALIRPESNLVTVAQELTMLHSFAELIRMRLESAFELRIRVEEQFLSRRLPHLSLQPLLENAVKHNAASLKRPLTVDIDVQSGQLVVRNTLSVIEVAESSHGLGLVNLNERFKMMMHREIDIQKDNEQFIVKLPLAI